MTEQSEIESAVDRLIRALDSLEAASNRSLSEEKTIDSLQQDVQKLEDDRSRLAQDLDRMAAQSARLKDVNREVSRRLVSAMESIRGVLDRCGG